MTDYRWLEPLDRALGSFSDASLAWFFRDDDAGWATPQLERLCGAFACSGIALDLAAIPGALDSATASRLVGLIDQGVVRVHQHGWQHTNHEPIGRACEFGASRSAASQCEDISTGSALLLHLLEGRAEPVFVPPWNRCTETTLALLADLGFAAVSRDGATQERTATGLLEIGIDVDWVACLRAGGPEAVAGALASAVGSRTEKGPHHGRPLGVMLHHAVMGSPDVHAVEQLLALLAHHRCVINTSLADLVSRTSGSLDNVVTPPLSGGSS
jgi:hypothetical protein